MKPTSDLSRLKSSIIGRTRRLQYLYHNSITAPDNEKNAFATFCVLELDNTIANLHREFLISSLYFQCKTCGGHKVSHNNHFPDIHSASLYIMRLIEPLRYQNRYSSASHLTRREETKIRDPLKLQVVAAASMLSNRNSIVNALGINSQLFSQIAAYRNFYAHRNEETAQRVRSRSSSIGLGSLQNEWSSIYHLLPGSPARVFEGWASDLILFTELLLE